MASVNRVILIGNLGRDPEIRYTQGGEPIANFSLATNEAWTDRSGQKQERTEWHRVVFFGGLADVACKYLEKGAQAYVEGKLRTRKWEDKQGVEHFSTEVVGKELIMLGKKTERYVDPNPDIPDGPDIPF